MKIITEENPILREKSQEVEDVFDSEVKKLIDEMLLAMKKHKGIGLAAPQLGILKRIITIEMKGGPLVLINPGISEYSQEMEKAEEGCLSLPGKYKQVERSKSVKYSGILPSGEKVEAEAKGLFARVIQHEIDHLDGILFIDRVKNK